MHVVPLRNLSRSGSTGVRLGLLPDGQPVVVKEARQPQARERLAREAAFLERGAGLAWKPGRAAGLPALVDAQGDRLVRAYVPGQTLAQLRRQGPLLWRQLCAWLCALEGLLVQLHELGEWHGDLSPENLLITADNELVLLDCGAPGWGTPPYSQADNQGADADRRALLLLKDELLGPGACRRCQESLPRLVGREEELAALQRAWRGAAFQESTWIGVEAASGGGKTALLRELLFLTDHRGWGQGSTLSTPIGYNLFQSLLEGWTAEDLPQGLPLTEIHWRQFFSTFPGLGQAEMPQSGVAPLLLAQAWAELLTELARPAPFLLVLDDVQWMDESSRILLQAVGRRPIPGLMVVLAWREGEFSTQDLPFQSLLKLEPLSPTQVHSWARRQEAELSEPEAVRLAEWTRGNPLLISEWLRQPQRPSFSPRAGVLLQDRVRQLSPEVAEVLQVAALLGSQFREEPLRGLGLPLEALDRAEELQLLLPGRRFSHDKVRESLLAELSPAAAQDWHRRLGDYFAEHTQEVSRAAFHYAHGDRLETAAPLALRAARQEAGRSALSSAAYFYEIACRHQAEPGVIWEYSRVLELLGHQDEAVEWLERGLRQCQDSHWLAPMNLSLATLHQKGSHYALSVKHCQEAWSHLNDLPAAEARELEPKILTTLLESRHENQQVGEFVLDLLSRLPRMGKTHWGDPMFSSDLLLAAGFAGLPIAHRRWRKHLLSRLDRSLDPLKWARVTSRLLVFCFIERRMAFHRRMLRALVETYREHGEPWEMCMNYMQLGLYAAVAGDFQELAQLAQQVGEVATMTGDGSQRSVSLHFAVLASGGRVSWQALEALDQQSVKGYGLANRALAQAHYRLRQGQPEAALELLRSFTTYNPIDGSMVRALHCTAARMAAEKTPRRWGRQRRAFYEEVLRIGKQTLNYGAFAHIHSFRARREMALAYLALEQPQPAQELLLRSISESAALGARYECALSQKAWSEYGVLWGWEKTEEWGRQARQTLEELGAWWDLAAHSWTGGLPLQELGQAAAAFLESPTAERRVGLERWVSDEWIERLRDTVLRSASLRTRLQQAQQERERENARWQAFVGQGPVEVSSASQQFTLPVRHHQLEPCARLIETEMADLREQLDRAVQAARQVAPSNYQHQLETALLSLENWHLGAHPPDFSLAWFAGDGELRLRGELPWGRLYPPGRAALAGVLREALQNARKHRPGEPVEVQFVSPADQLEVTVACPTTVAVAEPVGVGGFGLTSMQFRASLAGGLVRVDENYAVHLTLPLA
jgi:hypothetical protein